MKGNSFIKVCAALLVLVISAVGLVGFSSQYTAAPKAAVNNSAITETARKTDINVGISSTGTVYSSVTKDIVSNNNGLIKDLSVKEGDMVRAGQKLFTVDSDQIRQQVSSAEINLEKQNLQLNKMKTDDDKNLQYLQIKDAKNNLSNARQQLNNMTVTSPIDGVVTVRNNNNGDNVQSGKTVLSIIDPKSLKIKASVDELDISKVAPGQKVQVKFNAIEGKAYEATVETISSVGATTNNVTTYSVVIGLKDQTGVMIGMTANVNIEVQSKQGALAISTEALINRNGKKYVMLPAEASETASEQASTGKQGNAGNRKTSRQDTTGQGKLVEVQTGIQNANLVEITSGITEGQKVLITLPQSSANASTTRAGSGSQGGFGAGMGSGMMGGAARTGSGK